MTQFKDTGTTLDKIMTQQTNSALSIQIKDDNSSSVTGQEVKDKFPLSTTSRPLPTEALLNIVSEPTYSNMLQFDTGMSHRLNVDIKPTGSTEQDSTIKMA